MTEQVKRQGCKEVGIILKILLSDGNNYKTPVYWLDLAIVGKCTRR